VIKEVKTVAHTLRTLAVILVLGISPFLPGSVFAHDDDLPKVSHDGLELRENSDLRVVYVKPGATLEAYKRIALLDCFISFRKNWERDYNSEARGMGQRVNKKDMERIKKRLADEFRTVFTKELETDGGYEIVDEGAEDVLILRPAIINLDVTAPDTRAPGMNRTIVSSAGSMTLYLELYDSLTNDIIARVIDPRADRGRGGGAMLGNSVSNKAEADRILRRWADILRDHLDAARAAAVKKAKDAAG
jgi:putative sterol carrier protein